MMEISSLRDTDPVNVMSKLRSLHDAFLKAMDSVDSEGCLSAEAAREFRRAAKDLPADIRFGAALEPDNLLGTFESLPPNRRYAMVRAIARDDMRRMAGHNIGDWHVCITRSSRL